MSRRAADLVDRMNRLGAAPETPIPPDTTPLAPAPRPSGRGRRQTVRITFDLEADLHRSLRLFALDAGVAASDVVRAALQLLDDPRVRGAVMEVIDRD